ncbi:MAG: T9SS type A sorting domain-containing protein [Muribaculaceae bacterium]|nr:T9SS type A sorting domain-containing protein [Muribaculaceae bacterium]
MRITKTLILCIVFVMSLLLSVDIEAQLMWRETNREVNVPSLSDPNQTEGIEIYATQNTIIIRTPKKIQVRVFTILGQLVSQATLNVGTSELKISSRGIYIIKIGNITQKVAL